MKFFASILTFICFLIPTYVLSQDMPTATIVSQSVAYCATNPQNATIRVEFSGGQAPYSFEYMVNDQYGFEDGGENVIDGNFFEWKISPSETSTITLLEVFDQNNPAISRDPTGNDISQYEGGSDLVYGNMEIRVDKMPAVNAGPDDEVCGYKYNMDGKVTGETTDVWWSDPGQEANFNDSTLLSAVFAATKTGDYDLTLNAQNGLCMATDEVDITLKGRPIGEITNTDDWRFCSNDGNAHELPIDVSFTGEGDFGYTLKDEGREIFGPFIASASSDKQSITVSKNSTISFHSVEDGQGCMAEATDMQGSRTAIDVKPDVFAGDDVDSSCGTNYELKAKVNPATSGLWTSATAGIVFTDPTKFNSLCTATFGANETFKDATLRWTETTTDGLACANYDELDVKFIQAPTLAIESLSDEQICEDKSTTLDFEVIGNAPWTIEYNLGGASLSKSLTPMDKKLTVLGRDFAIGDNLLSITKIKDRFNCESTLSLTQNILVDQMPITNAGPDQDVCGTLVNLEAISDFDGQGEWKPSIGSYSDQTDPASSFTANNIGVLNLVWKETNGVCIDTDTVGVTFLDTPGPINRDTTIIAYAVRSIELNALPLTVGTGQWSILEPEITGASITEPNLHNASISNLSANEIYKLEWKAILESAPLESECRDTSYTIIIDSRPLLAPTGISPDGDGINDELIILGAKENGRLTVFDKQGKLVFKMDNYDNSWRGTDQSEARLTRGTYFYVYQDDEVTIKNYLIIKY